MKVYDSVEWMQLARNCPQKNKCLILQFSNTLADFAVTVYSLTMQIIHTGDLQTYLPEGHISYYTTFRGLGILRNVIVSGYATF